MKIPLTENVQQLLNEKIGNLYLPNYHIKVNDRWDFGGYEIRIFWKNGKDNLCLSMHFTYEFFNDPNSYDYIKANVLKKLKPYLKIKEYNDSFEEILK